MIWMGDVRHAELIARAAKTGFDRDVDVCISRVTRAGDFLGGFILTNYTGSAIMVHMAGVGHWATPELVWCMFDYCFIQLRLKKVIATVGSNNERSLGQIQRAGFKHEYSIADGIPNGKLHIYSMSREQCRWLKLRDRYLKLNGHGHAGEHVHVQP